MSDFVRAVMLLVLFGFMLPARTSSAGAVLSGGSWSCDTADTAAGCTNLIPPLPLARENLGLVTGADGRLYAIGGLIHASYTSTAEVDSYTPGDSAWATPTSLPTSRQGAGVTEGPDGKIYVIGGVSQVSTGGGSTTTAPAAIEAYNPVAKTWTCSQSDTGTGCTAGNSTIAPMPVNRYCPVVLTTTGGQIDVIGGNGTHGSVSEFDVYDPTSNTWSTRAPLPDASVMTCPAGALTPDGMIYLIFDIPQGSGVQTVMATYTPASNSWSQTPMPFQISDEAVVAGPDGNIYVLGGFEGDPAQVNSQISSAERYSPATSTWTTLPPMAVARRDFGAAVGPDGRIYVAGGVVASSDSASVEAYAPLSDTWSDYPGLYAQEPDDPLVALPSGDVYALNVNTLSQVHVVERYSPSTNVWQSLGSAPIAPGLGGSPDTAEATLGPDGKIYLFGRDPTSGVGCNCNQDSVEAYDPSTNTWTCSIGDPASGCTSTTSTLAPMPTPRNMGAAVTLDGKIYVLGGDPGTPGARQNVPGVVEAYDPVSNSWTCSIGDTGAGCTPRTSTITPMPTDRVTFGAAVGWDGRIYTFGGFPYAGPLVPIVEAFNPVHNTWECSEGDTASNCLTSDLPSLPSVRSEFTAATGPDGVIYLIGGEDNTAVLSSVEAYNTTTKTWTCSVGDPAAGCDSARSTLAPMPTARHRLYAATMASGQIMVAGGLLGDGGMGGYSSDVEIYTPPSNPLFAPISDVVIRRHHGIVTATWRAPVRSGIIGFDLCAGSTRLNRRLIPVHAARKYRYRVHYTGPGPFSVRAVTTGT